ncbi:MAG: hypothetical protein AAFY78_21720 [Cyanobacteria bacterium J06648_16]
MFNFVSKREVMNCLKLSNSTLKKYRYSGEWIEGLHWVRLNSRCVRYNLDLIKDWLHNRENPVAHERAISRYQRSLLSHPNKVRSSKRR